MTLGWWNDWLFFFRQPPGGGAGVFELKEEYLKEYCTYFYHFSKADQSKAEETQRKLRKDMPLDLSGIFSLIIDFVLNYFRPFFFSLPASDFTTIYEEFQTST